MRFLPFRKPTPPPMDPDSLLTLSEINKLPADERYEIRVRYGEILNHTQGVTCLRDIPAPEGKPWTRAHYAALSIVGLIAGYAAACIQCWFFHH